MKTRVTKLVACLFALALWSLLVLWPHELAYTKNQPGWEGRSKPFGYGFPLEYGAVQNCYPMEGVLGINSDWEPLHLAGDMVIWGVLVGGMLFVALSALGASFRNGEPYWRTRRAALESRRSASLQR